MQNFGENETRISLFYSFNYHKPSHIKIPPVNVFFGVDSQQNEVSAPFKKETDVVFVGCFQVTMLLPNFTEAEASQVTEESTRIRGEINDYNRRFSGEPRPVSQSTCLLACLSC